MRYWDSSALVPLLLAEESSRIMEAELRNDKAVATWWGARIECVSAICRRLRENVIDERGYTDSIARLEILEGNSYLVEPSARLRKMAEATVRRQALSAGDALQLAAALALNEDGPGSTGFVCLDGILRKAATREGFKVFPA